MNRKEMGFASAASKPHPLQPQQVSRNVPSKPGTVLFYTVQSKPTQLRSWASAPCAAQTRSCRASQKHRRFRQGHHGGVGSWGTAGGRSCGTTGTRSFRMAPAFTTRPTCSTGTAHAAELPIPRRSGLTSHETNRNQTSSPLGICQMAPGAPRGIRDRVVQPAQP